MSASSRISASSSLEKDKVFFVFGRILTYRSETSVSGLNVMNRYGRCISCAAIIAAVDLPVPVSPVQRIFLNGRGDIVDSRMSFTLFSISSPGIMPSSLGTSASSSGESTRLSLSVYSPEAASSPTVRAFLGLTGMMPDCFPITGESPWNSSSSAFSKSVLGMKGICGSFHRSACMFHPMDSKSEVLHIRPQIRFSRALSARYHRRISSVIPCPICSSSSVISSLAQLSGP